MQVQFINNCRFVLMLAWKIFADLRGFTRFVDDMIGSRGRLSSLVLPMSAMAAFMSFLSAIVYTRNYPHGVASMVYTFGSFLLAYILFVSILNLFASRRWFTDEPEEFCSHAKTFVFSLLIVRFVVSVLSSVMPGFRFAELVGFYIIYVSWSLSGAVYMRVPRYRDAFGIFFGAAFFGFDFVLHGLLKFCFPHMPL